MDEGGPAPQTLFKRVFVESDDAETADVEAGGVSESKKQVEDMLTIAPKPPSPPTPTLACTHPKHTVHVPIHDDDLRYSVSLYSTRKRTAKQAKVAQTDASGNPRTYAQAMARTDAPECEATCEAERHTFEHMGVYEVMLHPSGRKVVGSKWVFHIKHGPDSAIQSTRHAL